MSGGFAWTAGRALAIGTIAALRTPRWINGTRLRSTLGEGPIMVIDGPPDPELVLALRAANRATAQLARTRTLWRDTCLYRSMAQYLVLRAFGRPASIRLGVRNADTSDIHAHSWVAYGGPEPVQGGGAEFQELRFTE